MKTKTQQTKTHGVQLKAVTALGNATAVNAYIKQEERMNNPKRKLKKQLYLKYIKKNKILISKLNQGGKRFIH